MVTHTRSRKGASIKYVRHMLGFFDPLPPCANWLLFSTTKFTQPPFLCTLFYDPILFFALPPLMCTYLMDDPKGKARRTFRFLFLLYNLKRTLQSIIIGKGLRETAPAGRAKLWRGTRVPIASNWAPLGSHLNIWQFNSFQLQFGNQRILRMRTDWLTR